jgi:putative SOS response-associated peptidase YedK
MCGRYAATLPPEMMVELFKLLEAADMPPRYNIKPTDPIVAIREKRGERTARLYRWGLIPGWVKDPRDFPLLINARADGMLTKPAFRNAMKWGRCVVPADGYYEWMVGEDGKKHPYFITSLGNEPMAFAGLYATWHSPGGERIDSAAIVTVDPNLDISGVHDRMPAVLRGEAVDKWLNVEDVKPEEAAALVGTPPPGSMKYHMVGKAVGQVDAEGPDLIRPITAEQAAAEGGSARPKKKAAGAGQLDLF